MTYPSAHSTRVVDLTAVRHHVVPAVPQLVTAEIRREFLSRTVVAMEALASGDIPAHLPRGLWPSDVTLVRVGCRQTARAMLKLQAAAPTVPALSTWDADAALGDVHGLIKRAEVAMYSIVQERGLEGGEYVAGCSQLQCYCCAGRT